MQSFVASRTYPGGGYGTWLQMHRQPCWRWWYLDTGSTVSYHGCMMRDLIVSNSALEWSRSSGTGIPSSRSPIVSPYLALKAHKAATVVLSIKAQCHRVVWQEIRPARVVRIGSVYGNSKGRLRRRAITITLAFVRAPLESHITEFWVSRQAVLCAEAPSGENVQCGVGNSFLIEWSLDEPRYFSLLQA